MTAAAGLPAKVFVREVGPRDGFQNEPERIPTQDKIQLIDMLARTGVRRIEVASFVRADVIPQLSDAVEVLHGIDPPNGVSLTVLVPNRRGWEAAREHSDRFHDVGVFLSASDSHNKANVNRSVEESLAVLEELIPEVKEAGLRCSAYQSTAFGCPYEGPVDPGRVMDIAARLAAAGADELGFGDTTGMANPKQVGEFFSRARVELAGPELTAHFHNTRGQGLANVVAALHAGITSFDSSFGELGGCPVPPGSTGNIASEDLISMLHEMGIETGIDLAALIAASRAVQEVLGRRLTSHVIVAGPVSWSGVEH